jgi:hypothetical protein
MYGASYVLYLRCDSGKLELHGFKYLDTVFVSTEPTEIKRLAKYKNRTSI